MSLLKLSFSILLAAASATLLAQPKLEWVYKNEKDGVKVYYRKTSDVYEIKLVTSLKSPLSGIIHLFEEVENYPKWGYKIAEARTLHRISDTEMYYYSKLDFPWPINDRDIIMHTRLEQDPKTRTIKSTSTAVPNYLPVEKNIVRIAKATTQWTLIPGAGGWLYVEYYIYSNPGGNIPDWLVNMAIDLGPRETIKSIRKILLDPKYQNAKLAYIKE